MDSNKAPVTVDVINNIPTIIAVFLFVFIFPPLSCSCAWQEYNGWKNTSNHPKGWNLFFDKTFLNIELKLRTE
jgi:hypothetical protein